MPFRVHTSHFLHYDLGFPRCVPPFLQLRAVGSLSQSPSAVSLHPCAVGGMWEGLECPRLTREGLLLASCIGSDLEIRGLSCLLWRAQNVRRVSSKAPACSGWGG